MVQYLRFVLIIILVCLLYPTVHAQEAATQSATQQGDGRGSPRRAVATTQGADEPAPVVTEHELKLADQTLKYKTTSGFIPLKDPVGKLRAKVFYVA